MFSCNTCLCCNKQVFPLDYAFGNLIVDSLSNLIKRKIL